jgi:hypothetical protein
MSSGADCFERIEATLKRSVAALTSERVPFLLGGSLAVWARGGPETCNDLDLMVRPDDAERALAALERAGMRTERPAEGWLYKALDDGVAVDLIFSPRGVAVDEATFARAEMVSVFGVELSAMALEDVLVSKLLALHDHYLDFEAPLQMARAVRERVDWTQVRQSTTESPFARAFFTLVEGLGLVPARAADAPAERRARIRVAE